MSEHKEYIRLTNIYIQGKASFQQIERMIELAKKLEQDARDTASAA